MSGLPTRWRIFASESLEFVQISVSGPGAVVEPLKSAACVIREEWEEWE
ncbi:MAG: hypothetical protein ACKJSG_13725 [Lentisphaeria bacterium]